PRAWDVTRAHRNSLEPATRAVLASLGEPIEAWIVLPSLHGVAPVYDEVERVLARIARAAPQVRVRRFDPALAEGGRAGTARAAGAAGPLDPVERAGPDLGRGRAAARARRRGRRGRRRDRGRRAGAVPRAGDRGPGAPVRRRRGAGGARLRRGRRRAGGGRD